MKLKCEEGGSCSVVSGRFHWEKFVIHVDTEVS